MSDWRRKPLVAALAVAFAAICAGAWGSTTGPGTTGNGGPDPIGVAEPMRVIEIGPAGDPRVRANAPIHMDVPKDIDSYTVVSPGDDDESPTVTP